MILVAYVDRLNIHLSTTLYNANYRVLYRSKFLIQIITLAYLDSDLGIDMYNSPPISSVNRGFMNFQPHTGLMVYRLYI
jgi:hypothetical protein